MNCISEQPDLFHLPPELPVTALNIKRCVTRILLDDFYLCQTHRRDCEHASPFGVGVVQLCFSPYKRDYAL